MIYKVLLFLKNYIIRPLCKLKINQETIHSDDFDIDKTKIQKFQLPNVL